MDVTPVVPINLFRLTLWTKNDDKTLQFCRNIGMFPKDITCPNCGVLLEKVYKIKNRNTTHFRYQCNKRMYVSWETQAKYSYSKRSYLV